MLSWAAAEVGSTTGFCCTQPVAIKPTIATRLRQHNLRIAVLPCRVKCPLVRMYHLAPGDFPRLIPIAPLLIRSEPSGEL